jgi:hypothetical protein
MELILWSTSFIVLSAFFFGRMSNASVIIFLFSPIYYYLITFKTGDTRAVILIVVFIIQYLFFRESEECK